MNQINKIKELWNQYPYQFLDTDSDDYQTLSSLLDRASSDLLEILVENNIKFVSVLAQNKLTYSKHMLS